MSDPFVGWLSFGVQVALPPGVDPSEFAEELVDFIEYNLAGTIGVGERCLTGSVHYTDHADAPWHPPLSSPLRTVHAAEGQGRPLSIRPGTDGARTLGGGRPPVETRRCLGWVPTRLLG